VGRNGAPQAGARDILAGMSLFDPENPWLARVVIAFGFVGIAAVAFAAGWLVGTVLKLWQSLGG
jgi:hypothetical protein